MSTGQNERESDKNDGRREIRPQGADRRDVTRWRR